MYVVVHHEILDVETALRRGERLIAGEAAPAGVRVLQFYPATDARLITCLWDSPTVEAVQEYVDTTLGDASRNLSYEVDPGVAFAEQPVGLPRPQRLGI